MIQTTDKRFHIFKNKQGVEYIYSGFSGLILEYNDFIKEALNNTENISTEIYDYLFDDPFIGEDFSFLENNGFIETIQIVMGDQVHMRAQCACSSETMLDSANVSEPSGDKLYEGVLYFIQNFEVESGIKISFCSLNTLEDFYMMKDLVEKLKLYEKESNNIEFIYDVHVNVNVLSDEAFKQFLINNNFEIILNIKENGSINFTNIIKDRAIIEDLSNYLHLQADLSVPFVKMDLSTFCDQLSQMGIKVFSFKVDLDSIGKDINSVKENLKYNVKIVADYFIDNLKNKRLIHITNFLEILVSIHYGSSVGGKLFPCSACESLYAVNVEGDVYPCNKFNGIEQYRCHKISNPINNETRQEFLLEQMVFTRDSGNCLECFAKYLCGGTCYYNAYLTEGNIEKNSDINCYFNMEMIKSAIYIYTSMDESEREVIENLA